MRIYFEICCQTILKNSVMVGVISHHSRKSAIMRNFVNSMKCIVKLDFFQSPKQRVCNVSTIMICVHDFKESFGYHRVQSLENKSASCVSIELGPRNEKVSSSSSNSNTHYIILRLYCTIVFGIVEVAFLLFSKRLPSIFSSRSYCCCCFYYSRRFCCCCCASLFSAASKTFLWSTFSSVMILERSRSLLTFN